MPLCKDKEDLRFMQCSNRHLYIILTTWLFFQCRYFTSCGIFLCFRYACRKCQLVFPRKEACIRHQATSGCYLGKSPADNEIVKIEQEQYNCQACNVNSATIQEFKQHCQGEPHKYNRNKYNNNNNTDAPSAKRLRAV